MPNRKQDWVAVCAGRLREHWPQLALITLEKTAGRLWLDPQLRRLDGLAAAEQWLHPSSNRSFASAAV